MMQMYHAIGGLSQDVPKSYIHNSSYIARTLRKHTYVLPKCAKRKLLRKHFYFIIKTYVGWFFV